MINALAIESAVEEICRKQVKSRKPLAIILAGHNGSGKSTLWYRLLADSLRIPLINADRMMLSILPEPMKNKELKDWARQLRDQDLAWMRVAQGGVQAFIQTAQLQKVLFAVETVFSHWKRNRNGTMESKVDLIRQLQKSGYFVLLIFVGLSDVALSIGRVATRRAAGGHDVPYQKLLDRFPRTQSAIRAAIPVADASLLVDNSRSERSAFTLCLIRLQKKQIFDIRRQRRTTPAQITSWLDVVAPLEH